MGFWVFTEFDCRAAGLCDSSPRGVRNSEKVAGGKRLGELPEVLFEQASRGLRSEFTAILVRL